MTSWGTDIEREVRLRINVAVTAYAYEIADTPICADCTFDWLVGQVQPKLMTGHPLLDEFFLVEFSPMTGMWIHKHPELAKIRKIYEQYYAALAHHFDDARFKKLVRIDR